jgi:hypothetical protein
MCRQGRICRGGCRGSSPPTLAEPLEPPLSPSMKISAINHWEGGAGDVPVAASLVTKVEDEWWSCFASWAGMCMFQWPTNEACSQPIKKSRRRTFFSFVSIGHGSRGVGLERARLGTGRAAAAPELGLAPARRGQRLAQRPAEPRRRRDPGRRGSRQQRPSPRSGAWRIAGSQWPSRALAWGNAVTRRRLRRGAMRRPSRAAGGSRRQQQQAAAAGARHC